MRSTEKNARRASRIEADRSLVAASVYGQSWSNLQWKEEGNVDVCEGDIVIDEGFGVPEKFAIRLVLDPDYPTQEPEIYEIGKRYPHIADRHFYPDGRCCLWHWLTSQWNGSDPEAILHFLDQATLFFHRQLLYTEQDGFPGPQLKHGDEGTREAMSILLGGEGHLTTFKTPLLLQGDFPCSRPCPCGGARKYKKCHQPVVERIRFQVGQKSLRRILTA